MIKSGSIKPILRRQDNPPDAILLCIFLIDLKRGAYIDILGLGWAGCWIPIPYLPLPTGHYY